MSKNLPDPEIELRLKVRVTEALYLLRAFYAAEQGCRGARTPLQLEERALILRVKDAVSDAVRQACRWLLPDDGDGGGESGAPAALAMLRQVQRTAPGVPALN